MTSQPQLESDFVKAIPLADHAGPAPTRTQAAVFCAILLSVCVLAAMFTRGYMASVAANGDNPAYARVATAIQTWNLPSVESVKQFWGLPYFAAVLSAFLRIGVMQAIAVISLVSTVASTFLVADLWSGWVAVYFAATNYFLLQFGAFGGAEPLFVLLLLSSFWLARQSRWPAAAFTSALAVTVRPLGVFALPEMWFRNWRNFKLVTIMAAIVALVGFLYLAPLSIYTGTPFAHWNTYQAQDWGGNAPVTLPFLAVWKNFRNRANVGNLFITVVKLGYVALHLAALAGLCFSRERRRLLLQTDGGVMVILYSAFVILYNAPTWALSIYPRLLIPITPVLLHAYGDLLPKSRRCVAVLGLASVCLATGANLGFAAIQTMLHK